MNVGGDCTGRERSAAVLVLRRLARLMLNPELGLTCSRSYDRIKSVKQSHGKYDLIQRCSLLLFVLHLEYTFHGRQNPLEKTKKRERRSFELILCLTALYLRKLTGLQEQSTAGGVSSKATADLNAETERLTVISKVARTLRSPTRRLAAQRAACRMFNQAG